jgi:hypothetical protein
VNSERSDRRDYLKRCFARSVQLKSTKLKLRTVIHPFVLACSPCQCLALGSPSSTKRANVWIVARIVFEPLNVLLRTSEMSWSLHFETRNLRNQSKLLYLSRYCYCTGWTIGKSLQGMIGSFLFPDPITWH